MEFDFEVTKKKKFHVLGMVLENIPFQQGPKHIPQLWHRFIPRMHEVNQFTVKPYGEFGVMKDFDQKTRTFKYLTGFPVGSDTQVPNGMEKWTVPKQTYIAIKCRLNTLLQAVEFWQQWISRSEEYEYSSGIEFEWYPPGYHGSPKNWMYYCFPILKKKR